MVHVFPITAATVYATTTAAAGDSFMSDISDQLNTPVVRADEHVRLIHKVI